MVTIKLRSKKKNEINRFLSSFYNTDMNIPNVYNWNHTYKNPIELSDIIGVYIDNYSLFNLKMWITLDKNTFINVTNLNGNDIIKYLFERYPY